MLSYDSGLVILADASTYELPGYTAGKDNAEVGRKTQVIEAWRA